MYEIMYKFPYFITNIRQDEYYITDNNAIKLMTSLLMLMILFNELMFHVHNLYQKLILSRLPN